MKNVPFAKKLLGQRPPATREQAKPVRDELIAALGGFASFY